MHGTFDVLNVKENFRGLSYGNIAATQRNWLFSERPDYQYENDILFLRGSMYYPQWTQLQGVQGQVPKNPRDVFNDRTGDLEERIHEGSAIFIPVITATYVIGDNYDGTFFENEGQIRNAARRETRLSGDMWAVIKEPKDANWTKIVPNLKEHWVESPLFRLRVSDKNPFLKSLELPLEPGDYDAVVVGFYVLITRIDPGRYRIQFGAKGRGDYRTDAIYDIYVGGQLTDTTRDISDPKRLGPKPPNRGNPPFSTYP